MSEQQRREQKLSAYGVQWAMLKLGIGKHSLLWNFLMQEFAATVEGYAVTQTGARVRKHRRKGGARMR